MHTLHSHLVVDKEKPTVIQCDGPKTENGLITTTKNSEDYVTWPEPVRIQ